MKLIPHTIDFYEPFSFPTTCGGKLTFSNYGILIRYSLALHRYIGDEDVVEAKTFVTDKNGQTWQCIAHFCASQLLEFYYSIKTETVDFNDSVDDAQKTFLTNALHQENLLLERVSLCDDSRESRYFYLAGAWRDVYSKYMGCNFTIGHFVSSVGAMNQPHSGLVIQLNSLLFQRYMKNSQQDLEVDIVTKIEPQKILFLNTAQQFRVEMASGEMRDTWIESPIPLPIMFSRTDLPGAKQDAVSFCAAAGSTATEIKASQN